MIVSIEKWRKNYKEENYEREKRNEQVRVRRI